MSETVLVAVLGLIGSIIVALISYAGVLHNGKESAKKMDANMQTHQAVTDEKIDELTREVREHNGFARRMPVVEEQIKVINHRISDLEGFHKPQ